MSPIESTDGKRILVLGDYRQTIVVVRSLARSGYKVTLGTCNPSSSTALSRHVGAVWKYSHNSNEGFRSQLESHLTTAKPDFVFVVGESQLRSLAPAAPRFDALATWVAPAWTVVERCFDKHAMYALTRQLAIPTLGWAEFTDIETWRQEARSMGYPVVVKRRDSSALVRGHKALIFATPETFDTFLAGLQGESECSSLLLQKFARGYRHNCHFGAAAGQLVAYFEQRVIRTDELDCTGVGIEGISVAPSAALREYCARLTESLGYDGIGCIQFIVDEISGNVAFLELNPRMDSTAALPYHLRYDFPALAIDLARNRQQGAASPLTASYRAGVRYHWLYGDLLSWHNAWRCRQRTPLQLLAWAFRSALTAARSRHLTWDWSDPLPTLYMYWKKFPRFASKGRFSRELLKSRVL
jgi:carbamoylphosphate synthase large subunit